MYCRFAITHLVFICDLNTLSLFHFVDSGTGASILWKKQSAGRSKSIRLSCVEQMVLTPGNVQHLTRVFCKCVDAARRHRMQSALQSADSTLTVVED